MINFDSFFELHAIQNISSLIGIAPDQCEDNVIVTCDKNSVLVLKIKEKEQVREWTIHDKLTTKVVYDRRSEKYTAVINQRFLIQWSVDTKYPNSSQRLKFAQVIVDLVNFGEDTLILFQDGSFKLLEDGKKSHKSDKENTHYQYGNKKITDAKVHILPNDNQILTYVESSKNPNETNVVYATLNGKYRKKFRLARFIPGIVLSSFTILEHQDELVMMTVWSDGKIFTMTINETAEPECSPGKYIAKMPYLKSDRPMSSVFVTSDIVAMYGAILSGQEGASLIFYNTKYKIVRTQQFIKVYFEPSRIWSFKNCVLLAFGNTLYAALYSIKPDLLSELIGTQIAFHNGEKMKYIIDSLEIENIDDCIEFAEVEDDDVIFCDGSETVNEKAVLPKSEGTDDSDSTTGNEAIDAMPWINENTPVADGKQCPFNMDHQFDKALSELMDLHIDVELFKTNEGIHQANVLLLNENCTPFKYKSLEILHDMLVSRGASEHETSEWVMTLIIKANLLEDVSICMLRYTNIPERVLAMALNYVLDAYVIDESLVNNKTKSSKLKKVHTKKDVEASLDAILSHSVEHSSIIEHLSKVIDHEKLFVLLDHIYKSLTSTDIRETYLVAETQEPIDIVMESRLLSWFNALITCNFTFLITSSEEKILSLLSQWQKLMQKYREQINEMNNFSILLNTMLKGKSEPAPPCSWYSVDEIVIKRSKH